MEVKFWICIFESGHLITRVVSQICIVIVTKHLNHDLVFVGAQDLEVPLGVGIHPQLVRMIANSRVNMPSYDELAPSILPDFKLSFKPVKL